MRRGRPSWWRFSMSSTRRRCREVVARRRRESRSKEKRGQEDTRDAQRLPSVEQLGNVPCVPGFSIRFTTLFARELSLVSMPHVRGALHPSVPSLPPSFPIYDYLAPDKTGGRPTTE